MQIVTVGHASQRLFAHAPGQSAAPMLRWRQISLSKFLAIRAVGTNYVWRAERRADAPRTRPPKTGFM